MPTSSQYQPNDAYDLVATIPAGQAASNVVDLSGVDPCGFFIPAEFDGSTLTIQASATANGTFVTVQDGNGSDYSISATAGRFIPIPNLAIVAGLRFIKLVAGSPQTTTDTAIVIAARPV